MGELPDFRIMLAAARKDAGLSINKAAAKARVSRNTWGWWELGKTVPYKGMLPTITTALGLEPGALDEAHAEAVLARKQPNGAPA